MSVEAQVETIAAPVEAAAEVTKSAEDNVEKARIEERNRFTREESLRRELAETRSKLEQVKKNGWDLDILTKKAAGVAQESAQVEPDVKKELKALREELEQERNKRNEIEELQSIVDFTHKNSKYELINQLEDAPKYILMAMREHEKNTGKRISYEEACDYIETEIEKNEVTRFEKFSKTKKAESIYKLKQSAEQTKTASSHKSETLVNSNVKDAKAAVMPAEPPNLYTSNSKEAFNYFKKKHGF